MRTEFQYRICECEWIAVIRLHYARRCWFFVFFFFCYCRFTLIENSAERNFIWMCDFCDVVHKSRMNMNASIVAKRPCEHVGHQTDVDSCLWCFMRMEFRFACSNGIFIFVLNFPNQKWEQRNMLFFLGLWCCSTCLCTKKKHSMPINHTPVASSLLVWTIHRRFVSFQCLTEFDRMSWKKMDYRKN